MHHTHTMQATIAAQQAELETLKAGLADVRRYLLSEKFRQDTTVQTRDVLTRLDEVESAAFNEGEQVGAERRREFEIQEAASKARRHAEGLAETWRSWGNHDRDYTAQIETAAADRFAEIYGRENGMTLAEVAA